MTVRRVRPNERREGDPTPGMIREEAISSDGMWSGLVRTAPGMVSGWHHHGEYETAINVVSGQLRMEFGTGGRDEGEAGAGDFIHLPRGVIHR